MLQAAEDGDVVEALAGRYGESDLRGLGELWGLCDWFWGVVGEINCLNKSGGGAEHEETWTQLFATRARIAARIVTCRASGLANVILKVGVMKFLLDERPHAVVLTTDCLADFDRILADGDADDAETLEPELWGACARVRERVDGLARRLKGLAEDEEHLLDDDCDLGPIWREVQQSVLAVAGLRAEGVAGLRLKARAIEDCGLLIGLMDGFGRLQGSYLRDYQRVAVHHLRENG